MTEASGTAGNEHFESTLGGEGGAEGGLPPEGGADGGLPFEGVEVSKCKPSELEDCASVFSELSVLVLERRRAGKPELVAAAFS